MTEDLLNKLEALTPQLQVKDRGFALDLVYKGRKYGCSEGQLKWVNILIERATSPVPVPEQIGDLANVLALFEKAKAKWPKLTTAVDGKAVVIGKAGPKSKYCGGLLVTSDGGYGNNIWYGHVNPQGAFQPSSASFPALVEFLKAFAAAPAETAAKFGKKTGNCIFCNTPVGHGDDPRSAQIGYGPGCAKTWGLPWGTKVAREASAVGLTKLTLQRGDEALKALGVDTDYEAACETEEACRHEARAY